MCRRNFVLAVLLSGLVDLMRVDTVRSQDVPRIVQQGKAATVLAVIRSGRAFGSAFCISDSGFFVTNQHVVGDDSAQPVTLVLDPSTGNERVVTATVVRTDKEADLALLQCHEIDGLTGLSLGDDASLYETAELTVFGYPYGTALAVRKKDYPATTVSVGRVSALRRVEEQLVAIQLDAVINPGNSGGPVLDKTGHVVGVAVAKIGNTDLNLAIPVSRLKAFLQRPEVTFVPPTLLLSRKHEPVDLSVSVNCFDGVTRDHTVTIEWSSSTADRRSIVLESQDGTTFHGQVVPIPKPAKQADLNLVVEFDGGAIQGLVADQSVALDDQEVRLSEIESIQHSDGKYLVLLNSGQTINCNKLDRFPRQIRLGSQSVRVDLKPAKKITLTTTAGSQSGPIQMAIVVRDGDKEVVRRTETILLVGDTQSPQSIASGRLRLGGENPWPVFLSPVGNITYGADGIRDVDRRYVMSTSARLLERDFTLELEFLMPQESDRSHGTMTFIGLGTGERAAYDEPKNCAYLRIPCLYLNDTIGISNAPVSSVGPAGRMWSRGPHLARIRKTGDLVIFEIDMDSDGPSVDDIKQVVPSIRAFVPALNEKNTRFLFGGAALFTGISFRETDPDQADAD